MIVDNFEIQRESLDSFLKKQRHFLAFPLFIHSYMIKKPCCIHSQNDETIFFHDSQSEKKYGKISLNKKGYRIMALNPNDIQFRELKDMLSQLNKVIEQQTATIQELKEALQEANAQASLQKEQIEYLKKKLYGRSSEKREQQAEGQLTLFDLFPGLFDEAEFSSDPEVPEEEVLVVKEHKRKAKRTTGEKFDSLPVEEVIEDLPEEEKTCPECGTPLEKIGKEYVRQELVYIPATLKLVKYYRNTYRCPVCTEGYTPDAGPYFKKPDMPAALIPGSYASATVVSWCMYQKYSLAVPLYRQEHDWLQFGVELSRTTMANWIITCTDRYLENMYGYFHRELLKREFLMADETRVQVLKEPERRAQTQSFMWLVRSGEDGLAPIILFGYTETRARYNIERFLEGYAGGYLETDGYQGYNNLQGIRRCCCWSHVRRYFMDAIPKGKQKDLGEPAVQGVQYCDKLFLHERYCNEHGYTSEQRKEYRDRHSKPVIDAFFAWLEKQKPVKGSRFDTAVKYAWNRKDYLYTYLEDGRCSLSNNLSENSIRPFTLGRKNWLFAATPAGAHASAIVYSIIETAKASGLNIYKYLNYLLEQRPDAGTTDNQLERLAPWNEDIKEHCSK